MKWFRLRGGAEAGYLPWWERLRYWSIRKLAGRRMINANAANGAIQTRPQTMIWNCNGHVIDVSHDLHRQIYDQHPNEIVEEG